MRPLHAPHKLQGSSTGWNGHGARQAYVRTVEVVRDSGTAPCHALTRCMGSCAMSSLAGGVAAAAAEYCNSHGATALRRM